MSDRSLDGNQIPIRRIRDLLELPPGAQGRIVSDLVPDALRDRYHLPPPPAEWHADRGTYRLIPLAEGPHLKVEVWPVPEAGDPAMALELQDTHYGQVEAAWIVLSNVTGPRFDVDRPPEGSGGDGARNLREEIRALAAGLTPNQVRPGLGILSALFRCLEAFVADLGIDIVYVAPLAYHNAIRYEQSGFTYASGQEEMEWIHREFQAGGALRARMDGCRPFRMPWMADTVRGRSWAIHDDILDRRWTAPQMYKFVDRRFETCTFPDARW